MNKLKPGKALFDGNKPLGAMSEVRLMHSLIRAAKLVRFGLVIKAGKGGGYGE